MILPVVLPLWLAEPNAPPAFDSYGHLALLGGRFTVLDEPNYFEVGLEWRFPKSTWDLTPIVGLTVFERGSHYIYGGLRYEIELNRDLYLAPSFAAGFYDNDGTYSLGGPVEFRSALELGWHANDWLDVGLTFYHLSNANLYSSNKGSESLVLGVSFDALRWFE